MIPRNEMTWVRLTTGERTMLEHAAARAKKPLSTWIRELALAAAHDQRMEKMQAQDAVADLFDFGEARKAWASGMR